MKIAMIGAHGTGKTTLCFEVAAFLKKQDINVELVKEVARSCPLPINRDTNLEAQSWILHSQIAEEIRAGHIAECVLCDRSVIDNYAYLVWAASAQDHLGALITGWMQTYDFLWKVPITETPTFDGTRDLDVQFQRDIDALVDKLLDEHDVSHRRLDAATSRDDWINQITAALVEGGHIQKPLF
jgi:nicotinamide riboside kinase